MTVPHRRPPLGGRRLVLPRMRGRTSGIAVDVSETYAVQVHEGKIVRVEEYRHLADALARAG